MQHRDFPGGHPSQYYSGPKALNFRVLMGSGVVALVWPHHGNPRTPINLNPSPPNSRAFLFCQHGRPTTSSCALPWTSCYVGSPLLSRSSLIINHQVANQIRSSHNEASYVIFPSLIFLFSFLNILFKKISSFPHPIWSPRPPISELELN